jgi:hypothetical protein
LNRKEIEPQMDHCCAGRIELLLPWGKKKRQLGTLL